MNIHITGLVVRTRPESISKVNEALTQITGVEVHGNSEAGNLVVIVEQDEKQDFNQTLAAIEHTPNVIATSLVYHEVLESP